MTGEGFKTFGEILKQIEGFVWGVPLIVLINSYRYLSYNQSKRIAGKTPR